LRFAQQVSSWATLRVCNIREYEDSLSCRVQQRSGIRRVGWQPVRRRQINVVLNMALPCLLVLSFISGWVASTMGFTEFGLHKYSSIAAFVVAAAHLVLHWRSMATQITRLRAGPHQVFETPPMLHRIGQVDERFARAPSADVTATPKAA
jgi:hypothetical protein